MPSRRSRSPGVRDRSRSPERRVELPHGASSISESDYFQKSDEFRAWLKEEKGKYFDELSGDKARSYFRKFVKAWNRGKLAKYLYEGIDPAETPAATQTGYKWSFASKKTRADDEAVQAAKDEITSATYGREVHRTRTTGPSTSTGGSGRVQGPTLPSAADLTLARELNAEQEQEERKYKRKREKAEAKERIEDMVGPREVGKAGMLEKKRARRENDREFREKGDDGFEADESTLLGGGDSFKDRIAKRDAARRRGDALKEEKANAFRERATAIKEKEKATMDMFQQLAKQRFG